MRRRDIVAAAAARSWRPCWPGASHGRRSPAQRQRGGRAGHVLEDRAREQLYELAKKQNIRGRSKMGKWDLIRALRSS